MTRLMVFPIAIVGGGTAGLAAASMVSRMGQKAALLERESQFGGQWRLVFAENYRGSASCRDVTELLQGTVSAYGSNHVPTESTVAWMRAAYHGEGLERVVRAALSHVRVKEGKISRMDFATPQGRLSIKAKVVIDATGDAAVARLAGVPCLPGDDSGLAMAPVLPLMLHGADKRRFLTEGIGRFPVESGIFSELVTEATLDGSVSLRLIRRERLSAEPTVEELAALQSGADEDAETGLELAKTMVPGLEDARLTLASRGYVFPEGPHPVGCHVLSARDLNARTVFPDWAVGRMLPAGEADGEKPPVTIPYGSFLTKEIRNLILCGRSLSMESEAFSSVWGMPFALATGSAAGCAAVLSLLEDGRVKKVDPKILQDSLAALGMARP